MTIPDPAHPEWGGWGGRFRHEAGGLYRDAQDQVGEVKDARATVWRWREAFQAVFAAGREIHVILEVTDNGTPRLTAYRRVVWDVSEK